MQTTRPAAADSRPGLSSHQGPVLQVQHDEGPRCCACTGDPSVLRVCTLCRFDSQKNPDNENTFYEDDYGNPLIPREEPVSLELGAWSLADDTAELPPPALLNTVRSQALRRRGGLKASLGSSIRGALRRLRRR